jgi:hypothetical protein
VENVFYPHIFSGRERKSRESQSFVNFFARYFLRNFQAPNQMPSDTRPTVGSNSNGTGVVAVEIWMLSTISGQIANTQLGPDVAKLIESNVMPLKP